MWFASYLCENGVITSDRLAEAIRLQLSRRPPLGSLALRIGKLSIDETMTVLTAQTTDGEMSLGELAVERGFLSAEDLAMLVQMQAQHAPSLAEILIEIGAISQKELVEHLRQARLKGVHRGEATAAAAPSALGERVRATFPADSLP